MFSVELRENVFAVSTGLIASGYDLFELAADDPVLEVIDEINRVPWPEFVTAYFARARKEGIGVNPYWPRAAMLLAASFYNVTSPSAASRTDGTGRRLPERIPDTGLDIGFKEQLARFPVSPEEKNPDVLEWLLEFPDIWRQMKSMDSFGGLWAKYRLAMDARVKHFHKTTRAIIESFTNLTGVTPQSLPRVCVIPNPLQAPQVADFISKDGLVHIIVAEPRPSSIIHELLHDVFEPGIQAAKDRVVQFSHLLMPVYGKMVKMQYAWDRSPDSWLRVFEENFMRAASIWIEHAAGMAVGISNEAVAVARAHAQALSHAKDGFLYVPAMATLFFEEWQGLDEIGVFIDKALEACDRLK